MFPECGEKANYEKVVGLIETENMSQMVFIATAYIVQYLEDGAFFVNFSIEWSMERLF